MAAGLGVVALLAVRRRARPLPPAPTYGEGWQGIGGPSYAPRPTTERIEPRTGKLYFIDNAVQPGFVIRELAFMNDQARFKLAIQHLRNNLVERHNFRLNPRRKELQRQVCRRQCSWYSDLFPFDLAL